VESHGATKRQAAAQIMMARSYHRVCETRLFYPATTAGLIRTWFDFMDAKPARQPVDGGRGYGSDPVIVLPEGMLTTLARSSRAS
jgi:hypothetical protein